MKGPKLPERQRKGGPGAAANVSESSQQGAEQPALLELQQQLNSNPLFRQLVDQPDKLLSVLQHDQVLADAAAGSPEIAALLDPSTLKQVLSVLQGGPLDPQQQQQAGTVPVVHRKALMQLQNYAMQLQQARMAGVNTAQLQQPVQLQPATADATSVSIQGSNAGASVMAGSEMWAAMQQRFTKLQQRGSMLGAMPGLQGSPRAANMQLQQQQSAGQSQPLPMSWMSAQVQQQQHVEQQQPQQQQQHSQHSRLKDAASRSALQYGSSSSMGSPGSSPHVRLARLTMPDGLGSSGRIMSPLARVTSPSGLLGAAGSGQCVSPGSMGALQRRSSSSLSHRVLRHSAASPMDLTELQRCGSQALNVEQLQSGDVIVDITPPTRVTQGLAWSTDPTAQYVLDAASSGSFGQLAASDSSSQLPVSTLTASASTPSEGHGAFLASAIGAATGTGGSVGGADGCFSEPAPAGAFGGFVGQGTGEQDSRGSKPQQQQLYALPLLGADGSTLQQSAQAAAAAGMASSSTQEQRLAEIQAAADQPRAGGGGRAVSGRRCSNSNSNNNRQRASPQKLQLRVMAAAQPQQQQQLQEDHYSYVDLSDAADWRTVSDSKQAQEQQYYQQYNQQQQQQQQYNSAQSAEPGGLHQSAATTALAGARAAAAAGGSLDARTYYESVPPSTWRPTDVGSDPGDYLELYRRAYCSYADALFPPVWMGLLATLATLQLLPLWQLCLLGIVTFWCGLWLMAIKWAGVAPAHLGLSRVTPMLTVCLEVMCTGAFIIQVLPVMWLGRSLLCMALLVSSLGMMGMHLTAYLQDPGYTPLPDAEQGPYARHLDAASKRTTPRTAGSSAATAGSTASEAAATSEHTPLLNTAGQQQSQAGKPGGAAGPTALNGQSMNDCWTCRVKRNLRSKHCPLCRRCVERFDHHCPVLGNCVGAGNHKAFVAFLALMLLSQALFCHVVTSMLTHTYLLHLASPHSTAAGVRAGDSAGASIAYVQGTPAAASGASSDAAGLGTAARAATASGQHSAGSSMDRAVGAAGQGSMASTPGVDMGVHGTEVKHSHRGLWLMLQALWAAGSTHMGLLLLLLAQIPTMFISGFLLFRALGLAAANLTVNEWMNRQRYVHLHYTGAGFSNRFDRGVSANCYNFWCSPKFIDYWDSWEAGEQEMQRKGSTVLVPWSPTVLVRYWDMRWSKYQERLLSSRERRREVQMQRRMQALGLSVHS